MTALDDFWHVRTPGSWPDPPSRFSHSSIAEAEVCPRRWALGRAEYHGLGLGHGYPHRPTSSALSGQVAHLAIERINRAVNDAKDPTFEGVVQQLRVLGGISRVIADCASEELSRLADNPRAERRAASLEAALSSRISDLRLVVQSALNRVVVTAGAGGLRSAAVRADAVRTALNFGYHPEVELAPPAFPWIGYADAIRLSETECEIVDYKTGSPSPAHAEQLRLYALLWWRDSVINPAARPATRLVLVYPGSLQDVPPPTGMEMDALELEMTYRAAEAGRLLRKSPPPANVQPVACRFCDVKHLCDDYWTTRGQGELAVGAAPTVRSMQGVVAQHRGDAVTILRTEFDPFLPPGTDVVVTGLDGSFRRLGQRLRLIDVRVIDEPDTNSALVTLSSHSEVFTVPVSDDDSAEPKRRPRPLDG